MQWIEQIDRDLFLWLNGMNTPFMDPIMWYISQAWSWTPLFLFIAYYAFKKGGFKLLLLVVAGAGISVAITDPVSVHLFKNVFQRYRPSHNLEIKDLVHAVKRPGGDFYHGGKYGFISSHAANFMGIGIYLILILRRFSRFWWLLLGWVALIGYSRIYLGVHYPLDIAVGFIVGALAGILVYQIVKRVKIKNKLLLKES